MTARFVAFEGGEGCGKSTQARLLAARIDAVLTREPGGTDIGTRLRALVLDPDTVGLADRAEALLMAADRAQHVAEVVAPALAAGRHVVTDRFEGSSLAYQGFGRGLPLEEVRSLSAFAAAGIRPDRTVLLTVTDEVADARLDRPLDRMEQQGPEFHTRVLDGFRQLAAADPQRWVVVDGNGAIDDVADMVWSVLVDLYEATAEPGASPG